MATSLVRVYCAEGYDSMPFPHGLDMDVYTDDPCLSATGNSKCVVSSIVAGANALDRVVQQEFGCSFDLDAMAAVASSKSVGRR
eukprot:6627076-Pyramimonas_sp.AAC.1